MTDRRASDYFTARGLRSTTPKTLNKALRVALESMETLVRDDAAGLAREEQAALQAGSSRLDPKPGVDSRTETAVKHAAVGKRRFTTKAASKFLSSAASHVRHLRNKTAVKYAAVDKRRFMTKAASKRLDPAASHMQHLRDETAVKRAAVGKRRFTTKAASELLGSAASRVQRRKNIRITARPASDRFITAHNLRSTTPKTLNKALRVVLESMEPLAYGDAADLTHKEQAVLRGGGLRLDPEPGTDPRTEAAVKYAAIVKRSLTTKAASERLGLTASHVQQMTADRSLYSFLISDVRYIPDFQFTGDGLVPNIAQVNKALPPHMHPVGVYNWFHLPNADLFPDGDADNPVSPLEWLCDGHDPAVAVTLAQGL